MQSGQAAAGGGPQVQPDIPFPFSRTPSGPSGFPLSIPAQMRVREAGRQTEKEREWEPDGACVCTQTTPAERQIDAQRGAFAQGAADPHIEQRAPPHRSAPPPPVLSPLPPCLSPSVHTCTQWVSVCIRTNQHTTENTCMHAHTYIHTVRACMHARKQAGRQIRTRTQRHTGTQKHTETNTDASACPAAVQAPLSPCPPCPPAALWCGHGLERKWDKCERTETRRDGERLPRAHLHTPGSGDERGKTVTLPRRYQQNDASLSVCRPCSVGRTAALFLTVSSTRLAG